MIYLALIALPAVLGFLFFNHRHYWLALAGMVFLHVLGALIALWIGAPGAPGGGNFDLAVAVALGFAVAGLAVLVAGAVRARRARRVG